MVNNDGYPLVMTNSLLLKIAIEIVSFPMNSMVIFHSYVNVYQRVTIEQGDRMGRMGIYRSWSAWWHKKGI